MFLWINRLLKSFYSDIPKQNFSIFSNYSTFFKHRYSLHRKHHPALIYRFRNKFLCVMDFLLLITYERNRKTFIKLSISFHLTFQSPWSLSAQTSCSIWKSRLKTEHYAKPRSKQTQKQLLASRYLARMSLKFWNLAKLVVRLATKYKNR